LARNAFTAWCITGMFTVPSNSSPGSAIESRAVPRALNALARNEVSVVVSAMRVL
jgi:hypothetical protein